MTTRQIEIIENSWDFLLLNPEETSEIFYSKLFALDPGLRSIFKEDISSQAQTLISMVTFIVHKLHGLEEIMNDVRELGLRHKKYHVKPEYFATVESALLSTLENRLGKLWDDETRDAWTTIYATLSKAMMQAITNSQPIEAP